MRVYYPEGAGPFPCLVYFHGGGWVTLSVAACDPTIRALANSTGCAVVAVAYRKAPEHRFPAAVDDAWAATSWVRLHADELRLDPERIAVVGESAGGNLAAVTALRARDEPGFALRCQVLVCPVTDTGTETRSYRDHAEGYLLQRESMRWFFGHYLGNSTDADDHRVSPLRAADVANLPPAFIATAEYDPLRDDGRRYAERLRAAGVPTEHRDYPAVHGFGLMRGVLGVSDLLYRDIAAEVRQRMA
ncbi:alpha/beta hydrolase [Actinokineospora sp. PR83]|uniref:alpha/beta hydrolase n=1 Tax=Actinokineospora sp. PR83 TaxID=2884908 RepID=UPI0027E1AD56|nr:alpha/beta hydrolase [Actinokineospora sp. PR83]MCG8915246.1 alpha/beta hydrolase [Actinokineospora sp. PR83]